jgi:hypothetical protein
MYNGMVISHLNFSPFVTSHASLLNMEIEFGMSKKLSSKHNNRSTVYGQITSSNEHLLVSVCVSHIFTSLVATVFGWKYAEATKHLIRISQQTTLVFQKKTSYNKSQKTSFEHRWYRYGNPK